MHSGKSSYKCKNRSRCADPSTTRLIGAESVDWATPTAGNTESNIGDGDNSESALAGASSEILRLLVRLSSRLDILTAEVKLLSADNSALRVEVYQLRQAVLNETVVAASKDASPDAPERTAHSYASVAQGAHPKEGQVRHSPVDATTREIPAAAKFSLLFLRSCLTLSLQTGVFPENWKSSIIVPIFKSGNSSDVSNYPCIFVIIMYFMLGALPQRPLSCW
ncbi:hypothetical protein HPB47_004566 [Ixodes persulcatus]|uniref:Uncharacterized protein n=1 Tax=Ixodes persulcatus TaxID=34615 RepID=A0AC60PGZ1_IXOPE|nr:hypothetical protein HPB47_004566 [Ixodes persulcatus]